MVTSVMAATGDVAGTVWWGTSASGIRCGLPKRVTTHWHLMVMRAFLAEVGGLATMTAGLTG